MALDLTGGVLDNINFGHDASLGNLSTWTIAGWIYLDTYTNWYEFMRKDAGAAPAGLKLITLANDSVNGEIYAVVRRATINDQVQINAGIATGQWNFLVISYNSAAASGSRIEIFWGDLSTIVSSKGTGGTGTGAMADDSAGDFTWGTDEVAANEVDHKVAWIGHWNRVLTLAELQQQQFRPCMTNGCVLFAHPGFHGVTNIPDFSGNGNHGAGTGLALADHVPLGPPFGFDISLLYSVAVAGGVAPTGHLYGPLIGPLGGPI